MPLFVSPGRSHAEDVFETESGPVKVKVHEQPFASWGRGAIDVFRAALVERWPVVCNPALFAFRLLAPSTITGFQDAHSGHKAQLPQFCNPRALPRIGTL
jgi:hypothetical protein